MLSPSAATDQVAKYTGGFFQTNAYALPTPAGGWLLIDAPEGVAQWVRSKGWKIEALLLTHAHIDHIQDAAAVVREHGCPLYYHADGVPLLIDTSAYRRFGLSIDFEPVTGGEHIAESPGAEFAGLRFEVLYVPGHCPGSLCFYDAPGGWLFAGDVLFAGSVGRTDLPGGDTDLLLRGIRSQLLPLPGAWWSTPATARRQPSARSALPTLSWPDRPRRRHGPPGKNSSGVASAPGPVK